MSLQIFIRTCFSYDNIVNQIKQLIALLITSISNDPKSWILSVCIGLVTFYIARFYYLVSQYPPGPFPLPVLGNILNIALKRNQNSFETINDFRNKYGPIYTVWFGPAPIVVINDLEYAKEAYAIRNSDIAGREVLEIHKQLFKGGIDIVFADYGPEWESLRRVANTAVRRYAVTEHLAYLVNQVVDETVAAIKDTEGERPFQFKTYTTIMMYQMLASIAFGKRYKRDDPELLKFAKNNIFLQDSSSGIIILCEFFPFLKIIFSKAYNKMLVNFDDVISMIHEKYQAHLKDYEIGLVRDFSDALIEAKEESIAEGKESAPYLHDKNLSYALMDLFLAGSDTTNMTLCWIMVFMAKYPEMQDRMRKEVEDQVGERLVMQEDKSNCHYVNAFISETLRLRSIVPLGNPHKALCDTQVKGVRIKKNTPVTIAQYGIMTDPKLFSHAMTFKPQRWLESNGKYLSTRPAGFIPFGMGKRICLGEKLALADLFLIVVRMLQATSGYQFSFPGGPDSVSTNPDPKSLTGCAPCDHELVLKKVK